MASHGIHGHSDRVGAIEVALTRTMVFAAAFAIAACTEQTAPPPLSAPTRTIAASRAVARFDLTPVSLTWQQQARDLIAANRLSPLAAARVLAAVSVAEYQAVVASGEDALTGDDAAHATEGIGAGGRSALDAHRGAVAGSSVQVLSFFFPAAASSLEQLLQSEGQSEPGNVSPDFTRGIAVGRSAGDAMVTREKSDGFTTPWTGTVPVGEGLWIANGPPAGPTFGGVTPYLLRSGDQFRPPPPPAFKSPAFLADAQEILSISSTRMQEQTDIANFWNFPTGTFTPPGYWNLVASNYIAEFGLDELAATHAFALTQAAVMDALIGCWDAKYFYWTIRPSQFDPRITLVFALPNHPSYPSGHSCSSAAAATVLTALFPSKAAEVDAWVTQAGLSRMDAGIHYRFDINAGRNLGTAVARWAIARDGEGALLPHGDMAAHLNAHAMMTDSPGDPNSAAGDLKAFIGGWLDGEIVELRYTRSSYCDEPPTSVAPSKCEIGAMPEDFPRGGPVPVIYAIAPIGFTPSDPSTLHCGATPLCPNHPPMIDVTRLGLAGV